MKTFDELFREAAEISDKRSKIFNKLIEKAENEIIPAFAKVLDGYDIDKAFFTMYVQPFAGLMPFGVDEDGDKMWALAIGKDSHIWKCEKDLYTGRYTAYEELSLKGDTTTKLPFAEFRRTAIVDLIKKINNRIEELNKRKAANVEEAEALLNNHPESE